MKKPRTWFIQANSRDKYLAYEALSESEAEHLGGIEVVEKEAYDNLTQLVAKLDQRVRELLEEKHQYDLE